MRLPSAKSLILTLIGAAALLIPALTQAAEPKILRFAFQGELKSVDPYRTQRKLQPERERRRL